MAEAEVSKAAEEKDGGAVAVLVKEEAKPAEARGKGKTKRQPPYHVIIWNDETHTYEYVIELLMKIFGHPFEKAYVITDTVHHQGKGIALTTHKELAELKRDQVLAAGADWRMGAVSKGPIKATIEAAPD